MWITDYWKSHYYFRGRDILCHSGMLDIIEMLWNTVSRINIIIIIKITLNQNDSSATTLQWSEPSSPIMDKWILPHTKKKLITTLYDNGSATQHLHMNGKQKFQITNPLFFTIFKIRQVWCLATSASMAQPVNTRHQRN